MINNRSKAVFLDKDGTLIPDIPYNIDPSVIELNPFAAEGLQLLEQAGFKIIIISNQSGVAKGFFKEEDLLPVEHKLKTLLAEKDIALSGFFYCPHHPGGRIKKYSKDCDCRKPAPGLITRAAQKMNIDISNSWMIGDILNDIEAGNRAGCSTILIDNGNETEWIAGEYREPLYKAANLLQAAECIANYR